MTDTGGPVFPPFSRWGNGSTGITVRLLLAAVAMHAQLVQAKKLDAAAAFAAADAMIAEAKKP